MPNPNPKICNYCNTPDLHWKLNDNNKWWLHDADDQPHVCPTKASVHHLVNPEGRVVRSPRRSKSHDELQAEFNQIQRDHGVEDGIGDAPTY